jgi:hypothetical protein
MRHDLNKAETLMKAGDYDRAEELITKLEGEMVELTKQQDEIAKLGDSDASRAFDAKVNEIANSRKCQRVEAMSIARKSFPSLYEKYQKAGQSLDDQEDDLEQTKLKKAARSIEQRANELRAVNKSLTQTEAMTMARRELPDAYDILRV